MISLRSPKFLPALYGALVIAGIETVPGLNFINACCCAGILFGGFLAVFFYTQEFKNENNFLTREDSIELGIWAGILSAIAGTIINLVILALFGNIAMEMMLTMIENMNVEMPAEFQTLIDEALISKLTFFDVAFGFFTNLFINTIFSILGALIGWNVFRNKYGRKTFNI